MSDLRSILKKNLTNIIENTNVTVELCAQLQDRGLVKSAAYQKLTKFQREENHAEGAVYIYQNVVPTLDKVGEISFVEALRDGGNAKVVEILNEAGYVKPVAEIPQKLEASVPAEITEVKSVVMKNLGDIVKNTKITAELCLELDERKLLLPSEYEVLEKHQKDGHHTQGATYLYKTVLPKFDKVQQISLVEALAAGGNSEAVNIIRRHQ